MPEAHAQPVRGSPAWPLDAGSTALKGIASLTTCAIRRQAEMRAERDNAATAAASLLAEARSREARGRPHALMFQRHIPSEQCCGAPLLGRPAPLRTVPFMHNRSRPAPPLPSCVSAIVFLPILIPSPHLHTA